MSERYVDTREPEEDIRKPLRERGWKEVALPHGDFAFPEGGGATVLVERKTIQQFLTDMVSGTLTRQAHALVEATPYPILLLEGHWAQDSDGYLLGRRITWEQAWDYLQSLQDMGVRLQLTTSLSHTIRRLDELAAYYAKGLHQTCQRHPSGDPWVAVLCHVPGVGTRTAQSLLTRFSTLEAIVSATPEMLAEADKVGQVLARRIYAFWRER